MFNGDFKIESHDMLDIKEEVQPTKIDENEMIRKADNLSYIKTNPIDIKNTSVSDIIEKPIVKEERTIDLKTTYIGIYETNGGYRIGLFQKDRIVALENTNLSAQYYHDVLSDAKVALLLDPNGKDRKNDFSHPLSNDPEEMKQWRGVNGAITSTDSLYYNAKDVTNEIDRHFGLVEFCSVFPQTKSNLNIVEIIGYLATFTSKLNLAPTAVTQILTGLLNVAKYFENSNKDIPTFTNEPINEISLEDGNLGR